MNKSRRILAYSILASLPALAFAQGNPGQMPHGFMMNPQQIEQMHENMESMQSMMQQVPSAGSTKERQQLLQQHMDSMQQQMDMMHAGMMGPGMMNNPGQQSGNAPGSGSGNGMGGPMDNEQRMEMMEMRMNQMQLMMEQMLEHQRQLNRN